MTTIQIKPRALAALELPGGVEGEPELHSGTAINERSSSSGGMIPVLPGSPVPVTKRGLSCLNGTMLYGVVPVVDQVSQVAQ
jgi:hypothetical protein